MLAVIGLAALLGTGPVWAQYKWKDARGQLHVSDLPPPADIPQRDILQRPAPARPAAATPSPATPGAAGGAASAPRAASAGASAAGADPELTRRRQLAEQQARQKAQEDAARQAAQRAENCGRARDQLAMYQSGQRLVRRNRAGEREVVDEATRQAEMRLAQRVIASDCR
jgi:hypothetical protein